MPWAARASSSRASSRLLRRFTSSMTASISGSVISTPSAATWLAKSRSATIASKAALSAFARAFSRDGPAGSASARRRSGAARSSSSRSVMTSPFTVAATRSRTRPRGGGAGAGAARSATRGSAARGEIMIGILRRERVERSLVDLDLRAASQRGEVLLLCRGALLAQEPLLDARPDIGEGAAHRGAPAGHLEEVEPVRRGRHLRDGVERQLEARVEHLGHPRALAEPAEIASQLALGRDGGAARDVAEGLRAPAQLLSQLLGLGLRPHHHLEDAHLLRLLELLSVLGVVALDLAVGDQDTREHLVREELLDGELLLEARLQLPLREPLLREQVVEMGARVVGAEPQERALHLILADGDGPGARLLEQEHPVDGVLEEPAPQGAVGCVALRAARARVRELARQRLGRHGLAVHDRDRRWRLLALRGLAPAAAAPREGEGGGGEGERAERRVSAHGGRAVGPLRVRRRRGRARHRAGARRHAGRGDRHLLELGVVHLDVGVGAQLLHELVEVLRLLLAVQPGRDLRLHLVEPAAHLDLAPEDADEMEAVRLLDHRGSGLVVAALVLRRGVVGRGAGERGEGVRVLLLLDEELREELLRLDRLLRALGRARLGLHEDVRRVHAGGPVELVGVLVVVLLHVGLGDAGRGALVLEEALVVLRDHHLLHREEDVGVVREAFLLGRLREQLEPQHVVEELLLAVEVLEARADHGRLLVEARLELVRRHGDAAALGDDGALLAGGLAAGEGGDEDRGQRSSTKHEVVLLYSGEENGTLPEPTDGASCSASCSRLVPGIEWGGRRETTPRARDQASATPRAATGRPARRGPRRAARAPRPPPGRASARGAPPRATAGPGRRPSPPPPGSSPRAPPSPRPRRAGARAPGRGAARGACRPARGARRASCRASGGALPGSPARASRAGMGRAPPSR